MKRIKILLLGITGDLARIKVLPALSEFATLHQKDFEVHLIGYSRSKADEKEVENILNQNSKHDKHKIKTIEYIQDSYNNIDRFNQIIDGTSKQDKLIIYLAVPPVVFIPFLKSACPLDPSNLHIVIEKPFGRSIEELARSLILLIPAL
ncbi:MAG: hypothetical protein HC932_05770 [Thermales bacterium]|nr:hypothetical protein [Thermales bacterium]